MFNADFFDLNTEETSAVVAGSRTKSITWDVRHDRVLVRWRQKLRFEAQTWSTASAAATADKNRLRATRCRTLLHDARGYLRGTEAKSLSTNRVGIPYPVSPQDHLAKRQRRSWEHSKTHCTTEATNQLGAKRIAGDSEINCNTLFNHRLNGPQQQLQRSQEANGSRQCHDSRSSRSQHYRVVKQLTSRQRAERRRIATAAERVEERAGDPSDDERENRDFLYRQGTIEL